MYIYLKIILAISKSSRIVFRKGYVNFLFPWLVFLYILPSAISSFYLKVRLREFLLLKDIYQCAVLEKDQKSWLRQQNNFGYFNYLHIIDKSSWFTKVHEVDKNENTDWISWTYVKLKVTRRHELFYFSNQKFTNEKLSFKN